MPYQIVWSEEHQAFAVTGLISKGEMAEFKLALDTELRAQHAGPANWHAPLLALISTLKTNNPKLIHAIKLWRAASRDGLKEAKDLIEDVRDGRAMPPNGNEFPDVSHEIIDEMEVTIKRFSLNV